MMTDTDLMKLDTVLHEVRQEVIKARSKHASMHSPHEGYAVLQEEADELWDEVKEDRGRAPSAMKEAVQVAAMGVRYVMDLGSFRQKEG